jgi:hypothetical protein
MAKRKTAAEEGMIGGGKRPSDWVLAHNTVRPEDVDTRDGWNGFRRFWISPEKKKEMEKNGLRLCNCGWRPELGPHYSALAETAE